jgi:hypothetical protein
MNIPVSLTENERLLSFAVELPPGKYFFADPMLLFCSDIYRYLCDGTDVIPGVYHITDIKFALNHTGFFEGTYHDTTHNTIYQIISGSLCLIPSYLCSDMTDQQVSTIGKVFSFDHEVLFYSDGNGYFEILSTDIHYDLDTRLDDSVSFDEDYDY